MKQQHINAWSSSHSCLLLLIISDVEKMFKQEEEEKFTFENWLFCFDGVTVWDKNIEMSLWAGKSSWWDFFDFHEYFQTIEDLANSQINICMRHLKRTKTNFQQQHSIAQYIETSNTPSKFQLRISISYEKFSSLTDFLWEFSTQWLFTSQSIPKISFSNPFKEDPFFLLQQQIIHNAHEIAVNLRQ